MSTCRMVATGLENELHFEGAASNDRTGSSPDTAKWKSPCYQWHLDELLQAGCNDVAHLMLSAAELSRLEDKASSREGWQ